MDQVDVVLIYPQRAPSRGRHWIMPSLGLAYLSSAMRNAGSWVRQVAHPFLDGRQVLAEVERLKPAVIGIYCMVTMQDETFSLARDLRGKALLVVGGPYPSGEPEPFLDDFDLVGVGEGEETIVEILRHLDDRRWEEIKGLAFKTSSGEVVKTEARARSKDMSVLAPPYRGDLPNAEYIDYWRTHAK